MKVVPTSITDVLILEPSVFEDRRGYFMEIYQRDRYAGLGIDVDFVQDNLSVSLKGTLRGLHFQYPHGQAKLVQVLDGEVFDVAVDVRRGSPTFGGWVGVALSCTNHRQLFIPQGFAHGFCVTSETAVFHYKCGDFYTPSTERGIIWNDADLKIDWPQEALVISEKDAGYGCLKDMPEEFLPVY
ncbi:MAG: dTDP-4-dehydrorhamnose 3,5-epimerase [Desulfatiglandaceae bacterium]